MKGSWWSAPLLAVIVLSVFLMIPPIEPLTGMGMKVVGLFFFTVVLWVFVGIGYPSLIALALFIALGVMSPKEAFAISMGNWIVIFIIACLGLAESLRSTGLSRRFALWFMSRPFTTGRPWLLLAMLMLTATLMGGVMSSTATLVILMAVTEPMLEVSGFKKGDRFAAVVMMGLAWAATAAFMTTPIGHGSNVLLIDWIERDVGYSISFVSWMAVGIPIGILIFLLILVILRFVVRADASRFGSAALEYIVEERRKMGPISLEEKMAALIFASVVAAWMIPGMVGNLMPGLAGYFKEVGYAVPAIIGTGLLCTIKIKGKPLMNFGEWMQGIEWSAIMLIAAIMILGNTLGSPQTGIPQMLTGFFGPIASDAPFLLFLIIAILWPGVQTNIMSNLVTATLVYTIMVPAAITAGVGNPAALGFSIFAATRFAFALPSATVVTAIVTGSGWVPVNFMARYGALTIIPIVLLIIFVCYPLASFVFR